jgi:alanine dehydrogenase
MKEDGTVLLTRQDVSELLGIEDCIAAVENAFRLYGEGKASPPGIMGIHARDGGFHTKAGMMNFDRPYFVSKTNANFPQNRQYELPTIQGVVIVFDGNDGRLLAVMDSIEITVIRTGAATAVAAKYLSRADAETAMIFGAGNQGRISLQAISKVRDLRRAFVFDIDGRRAKSFAEDLSKDLQIPIEPVADFAAAVSQSDICVTCTPSKEFYLMRHHISPGTFIAAVGSDSEEKQELEPAILKDSKIVADILEQCASIGELHHALSAGVLSREDVHAELGEIIAGKKPAGTSDDEIIVFDSTGMALQDVAAAVIVYEKALQTGSGKRMSFY